MPVDVNSTEYKNVLKSFLTSHELYASSVYIDTKGNLTTGIGTNLLQPVTSKYSLNFLSDEVNADVMRDALGSSAAANLGLR